jgi:hypothetical protein
LTPNSKVKRVTLNLSWVLVQGEDRGIDVKGNEICVALRRVNQTALISRIARRHLIQRSQGYFLKTGTGQRQNRPVAENEQDREAGRETETVIAVPNMEDPGIEIGNVIVGIGLGTMRIAVMIKNSSIAVVEVPHTMVDRVVDMGGEREGDMGGTNRGEATEHPSSKWVESQEREWEEEDTPAAYSRD